MLRTFAILCVLWTLAPAYAEDSPDTRYQTLLAAAKQGLGPVDWQALRFAYAGTADFDPFGAQTVTTRQKMFEAFQAGKFSDAIEEAKHLIDRAYVDVDAHVICDLAYQKLGDPAQAKPHHEAALGLLNSIRTGNGRTPETSYTVISVNEEYAMLHVLGLLRTEQNLIRDHGHAYDKLDVVDRDGKQQSFYFLIDRVLAAEAAALKAK
jgi:hypothetical protein